MNKLKQILIPSLALFIICATVSLALAATDYITKDKIAEGERIALELSLKTAIPNANGFDENEIDGIKYYTALNTDVTLGYIIETSAKGYSGDITVLTAINTKGEILKVTVTDVSSETTGIGTKVTNDEFLWQFEGFTKVVYEKSVDAITGATYSSQGVKDAVDKALEAFEKIGGAE